MDANFLTDEERNAWSVSAVNSYVKNMMNRDVLLRDLTVRGEVSNCRLSGGNLYFSLKDERALISAVMFRSDVATGLDFDMENGQAIVVKGRVDVFERDGKYQFYVKTARLYGVGAYALQYERLKARLNEEGLFDFEHKKEIVKFPRAVGVIAAGRSSAFADVKTVAEQDNPYVQLIFYPSKIQGNGAAESIVRGIETLDAMEEVDTIILARGGGSNEDLRTFNDESIVRAVFEANTPIIAGLGHADYITLTDYVADLRVITPTDAAKHALPNVMTNVNQLHAKERLLHNNMNNSLRLTRSRLNTLETKLSGLSPERRLADRKKHLEVSSERLKINMDRRFEQVKNRYGVIAARLHALAPTSKLVGGFGYVESSGKPLTSAKNVKSGDKIEITLSDGVVKTTAD